MMISRSVFNDLAPDLASLAISFRAFSEKCLADAGLDRQIRMGMASVYFALLEDDDCIIKGLVDRLGIPNGTMSGLLDRLEKAGVIDRRRCSEDGRARRVKLTARGHKIERAMQEAHRRGNIVIEADLSKKEVKELKRLLKIVRQSIESNLVG